MIPRSGTGVAGYRNPCHAGVRRVWLGLILALIVPTAGRADGPIELRDGDRVVLVGGTTIEREAESGYLETRLARRYPGRQITVRNLGWSGDTVGGESRSLGNPPRDGFRQLVDHVVALEPTVIVLGYGANEAYAGAAGLPAFHLALVRLWDALAPTGARFVVLAPTRQVNLGPPLPDPTAHNADLRSYGLVLLIEARRRDAVAVDLFDAVPDQSTADDHSGPLTTNGLHLTPAGYRHLAARIAPALGDLPGADPVIAIADGRAEATGATVADLAATPTALRCRVTLDLLPEVAASPADRGTLFRMAGLTPGSYALRIDGKVVAQGRDSAWRDGVAIGPGPDGAQVEELRRRIVRKDLLYFHRWRPQNETYLFGSRKHEQGRNVAELAAFDPLIAAEEAEIVRLSRPVPHTYEISRQPEGEAPR